MTLLFILSFLTITFFEPFNKDGKIMHFMRKIILIFFFSYSKINEESIE
jgi:hypothetical protein